MAKLYKSGGRSSASNAKSPRQPNSPSVPFQPVRGGAKVLGSKPGGSSKKDKLKLKVKTKK